MACIKITFPELFQLLLYILQIIHRQSKSQKFTAFIFIEAFAAAGYGSVFISHSILQGFRAF